MVCPDLCYAGTGSGIAVVGTLGFAAGMEMLRTAAMRQSTPAATKAGR
jgi:hypothetical protein